MCNYQINVIYLTLNITHSLHITLRILHMTHDTLSTTHFTLKLHIRPLKLHIVHECCTSHIVHYTLRVTDYNSHINCYTLSLRH